MPRSDNVVNKISYVCCTYLDFAFFYQGDILINGNDAKIVERHLQFVSGIAYGIDKVLEPPNIGAHCDDFSSTETQVRDCIKMLFIC